MRLPQEAGAFLSLTHRCRAGNLYIDRFLACGLLLRSSWSVGALLHRGFSPVDCTDRVVKRNSHAEDQDVTGPALDRMPLDMAGIGADSKFPYLTELSRRTGEQ